MSADYRSLSYGRTRIGSILTNMERAEAIIDEMQPLYDEFRVEPALLGPYLPRFLALA